MRVTHALSVSALAGIIMFTGTACGSTETVNPTISPIPSSSASPSESTSSSSNERYSSTGINIKDEESAETTPATEETSLGIVIEDRNDEGESTAKVG